MKKKIAIVLVLVLAVVLCLGGLMIYQSSQSRLAKEQNKQAQEQLKVQSEQEEQTEEEKEEASQEDSQQAASIQEDGEDSSKPGLENEAQISKPSGMLDDAESIRGMDDLKSQLETITAGHEGDWSVYVKNLSSGEYLEMNSHAVKAASLIKLYIMGAVLEQVEAGNLTADETLNRLLADMITISDNESSNELVRRLSPDGTNHEEGMEVVNAFARAYGYADTSQGRDLRDYREVPAAGENYTSVKDCGLFLQRVYEGECVSQEASAKMLDLLKQQTRTWKIPAGVPAGIVTANKTGELGDTENDTAIIFSPGGDYILCVTATNLTDTAAAQANIVSISSTVYQYMNP